MSDDVIFDGNDDIDEWETVDQGPTDEDYNDYDLEFVDDYEDGDYWIGTYTGTRLIGDAESPSCVFDNDEEELSFAFPNHVALKTQLADTTLSENQTRADNPVEKGEKVAIVYKGTRSVDGRPMDMHVWELRRPPQ